MKCAARDWLQDCLDPKPRQDESIAGRAVESGLSSPHWWRCRVEATCNTSKVSVLSHSCLGPQRHVPFYRRATSHTDALPSKGVQFLPGQPKAGTSVSGSNGISMRGLQVHSRETLIHCCTKRCQCASHTDGADAPIAHKTSPENGGQ